MLKIDIEKIKETTNNKIGYSNYMEEARRKKIKMKYFTYSISLIFLFVFSAITVNATTNNGIVNLVKRMVQISGETKEVSEYKNTSNTRYYYDELGNLVNDSNDKCISYYPNKEFEDNNATICYPEDTEFDEVEIYYDSFGHFNGFHITGTTNGEYFENNMNPE